MFDSVSHAVMLSTAASSPVRVVVVSSQSHAGPALDYSKMPSDSASSYSSTQGYQQSKYALNLFAYELNRRYHAQHITAYTLHLGFVMTHGMDKSGWIGKTLKWVAFPFAVSIPQGTATVVYCAVRRGLVTEEGGAGQYFVSSEVD